MAAAICPAHGDAEGVTESPVAEQHLGRWQCARCNLYFAGGSWEWSRLERSRRHRQLRAWNSAP